MSSQKFVVLGAGVVGLSTAIRIQETFPEAKVLIVAESFPGDAKSIRYTSPWAGAHHVSHADEDVRQNKIDRETFGRMWEMSAPGSSTEGCFLRLPQTEYYMEKPEGVNCLETMPDYRVLDESELSNGTAAAVQFTTLTIDTPVYLPYLLSLFLSKGGQITRSSIQHISQALDGSFSSPPGQPPSGVVVCLGLGARFMGGIEDKDVYPIRGQTVLVKAPWVRFGRTIRSNDGTWTYIIPRRSGDVIIGGTKTDNDWYPHARSEVTESILERCLALCPELVESTPEPTHKPTVEDLRKQIIEVGCGLRPARKGGIRLEVEDMLSTAREGLPSLKVPVVYNYGHGGFGYQGSWGSASIAVDLLKKATD